MPSSSRKTEANRDNAKHSTGPKSEAGKSAVRWNALKHGLLAQTPLLPHENKQTFVEFESSVTRAFAPDSGFEDVLVERIVLLAWRLRRIGHVESGLLTNGLGKAEIEDAKSRIRRCENDPSPGLEGFVSVWRRLTSTLKMRWLL